jgi:hypothetical protein
VLERTFADDRMIPSSLVHTVVETACPYGWLRLAMVHQSIFHLDLFSFNPRLASHYFSLASRFDSMTSSYIFGSLKGPTQSSVLGGIGLSVPLMMSERDLLTRTFCLSELGESFVDNCSKRHSFRFALLLRTLVVK